MLATITTWMGDLPASAPAKTGARMAFTICVDMSSRAVVSRGHSG